MDNFFFKFNKSRDGVLRYSEFMNALCPQSENYASMLKQRKAKNLHTKPKHPILVFEADAFNNLIRVLEDLFKVERETCSIVGHLLSRPMFDNQLAFTTLCHSQQYSNADMTHITFRDFQSLLEAHGHKLDVDNLDIRLLIERFDLTVDGTVSRDEWFRRLSFR